QQLAQLQAALLGTHLESADLEDLVRLCGRVGRCARLVLDDDDPGKTIVVDDPAWPTFGDALAPPRMEGGVAIPHAVEDRVRDRNLVGGHFLDVANGRLDGLVGRAEKRYGISNEENTSAELG